MSAVGLKEKRLRTYQFVKRYRRMCITKEEMKTRGKGILIPNIQNEVKELVQSKE